VVAADPSAPAIAILLDHVAIHRCRAVTRWLGEHRVRLVFGPRSCPHHHPVERIWGAMKTYLASTPVETMAGRVGQVQAFFRERSQEQLLRCASPDRSPWLPEGSAQNVWKAA
jgi:transposase